MNTNKHISPSNNEAVERNESRTASNLDWSLYHYQIQESINDEAE